LPVVFMRTVAEAQSPRLHTTFLGQIQTFRIKSY
jgi:hypothetical protein